MLIYLAPTLGITWSRQRATSTPPLGVAKLATYIECFDLGIVVIGSPLADLGRTKWRISYHRRLCIIFNDSSKVQA